MSELRLSRWFAAAPERVFAAWTDPGVLRRWWAAHPDWDSPAAEADARPGGREIWSRRSPWTLATHPRGTRTSRRSSGSRRCSLVAPARRS